MNVINNEAQKALDSFLVGNDDLEQLNARLASFNLFNVLRIERAEIRHSNVLAWLLTPGESHGFGDAFIRRYLSTLLMDNDVPNVSLTAAQVELMSFRDVEVMREWNNIDIFVVSRIEKWFLLIENKIGSKESSIQLVKCKKRASESYSGFQEMLILLTVDGDEPSEQAQELGYVAATHGQVLEIAESLRRQHDNRIPEDAKVFLDHYLDVLRRVTMQDDEIAQLCKRIYRRHRAAIELIVEHGASSQVIDSCERALTTIVPCEFVKSTSVRVWFLPSNLGVHLQHVEMTGWKTLPRPVPVMWFFSFNKKNDKLSLIAQVGPLANKAMRARFLRELLNKGLSFSTKKAENEDGRYTRIVSIRKKISELDPGEGDDMGASIVKVASELWKKVSSDAAKIVEAARQFNWKS